MASKLKPDTKLSYEDFIHHAVMEIRNNDKKISYSEAFKRANKLWDRYEGFSGESTTKSNQSKYDHAFDRLVNKKYSTLENVTFDLYVFMTYGKDKQGVKFDDDKDKVVQAVIELIYWIIYDLFYFKLQEGYIHCLTDRCHSFIFADSLRVIIQVLDKMMSPCYKLTHDIVVVLVGKILFPSEIKNNGIIGQMDMFQSIEELNISIEELLSHMYAESKNRGNGMNNCKVISANEYRKS